MSDTFQERDLNPGENYSYWRIQRLDLTIQQIMTPGWILARNFGGVGTVVYIHAKDGFAIAWVSAIRSEDKRPVLSFVRTAHWDDDLEEEPSRQPAKAPARRVA